jgi:type IV pilus assembly protein PilB
MPVIYDPDRKSFHQKIREAKQLDNNLGLIWSEEEEQDTKVKAAELGLEYLNLKFVPINQDALRIIPIDQCMEAGMACVDKTGERLKITLTDIENELGKNLLHNFYINEFKVDLFFISKTSLEKALRVYRDLHEVTPVARDILVVPQEYLDKTQRDIKTISDFTHHFRTVETSDLLQMIVSGAIVTIATDIHIVPSKEAIRLRYRIDGMLQDIMRFDLKYHNLLVSRIKTLASLILNIKTTSQDGRFTIRVVDKNGKKLREVEVRVSILPGKDGETVVLRLLNLYIQSLDIHDFDIRDSLLKKMLHATEKPEGMILMSGPTGSGKTTTLYALLNYINRGDINIITIEDPIEYHLKNINQTQIDEKHNYTFARGLRAIVRQDPDVIMVGEIRDKETAQISVNAAITGHLVMSTLHTNSSTGIIPRIIELGMDRNSVVSAMNLYLAQRLIRFLCPHCKEAYTPSEKELEKIYKALALISPRAGVTIPKKIEKIYRPKGCEKCLGIGYKDRFAVWEMFEPNETINELILTGKSEYEIFKKVMEFGTLTLFQDSILKVIEGVTSFEEVIEYIGESPYIDEMYDETMSSLLSRGIKVASQVNGTPITIPTLSHIVEVEPIERALEILCSAAVKEIATDIHFEPRAGDLKVRFRVDGILYDIVTMPKTAYPIILSQVKIMTNAALDVTDEIQEGRFNIYGEKTIDVRVSIIPGGYGQTIVLRILHGDIAMTKLDELGLEGEAFDLLMKEITKTTGLILATGPTSSGKTTTLYSILTYLNAQRLKIITVEDPIEYKLPAIIQTNINTEKYSFAQALRSILRQNPNIVMLGEVRDAETAQVSIQAAATGHLLFTTLHTNDAVSSVLRLYDLGIGLAEIATFVNCAIGQRLVRKLCNTCKQEYILTDADKEYMLGILPQRFHNKIADKIYVSNGCSECREGYKGMRAIFEVFVIDDKIRRIIPRTTSVEDLRKKALQNGMINLHMAGLLRILDGETDPKEIQRNLGYDVLPTMSKTDLEKTYFDSGVQEDYFKAAQKEIEEAAALPEMLEEGEAQRKAEEANKDTSK